MLNLNFKLSNKCFSFIHIRDIFFARFISAVLLLLSDISFVFDLVGNEILILNFVLVRKSILSSFFS